MIPAKPISMIGPMVRAILEGRKTQTRRVLHPQPKANVTGAGRYGNSREGWLDKWSWLSGDQRDFDLVEFEGDFRTGYLEGELRWVREACCLNWLDRGTLYKADGGSAKEAGYSSEPRWRPPMYMPRVASRITLRVTEVRVQRLHEITAAEAEAEGVVWESADPPFWYVPHIHPHSLTGAEIEEGAVACYGRLWNWINTRPGHRWQDNPWVVAVTFEARQGNVDLLSDGDLFPEEAT